MAESAAFLECPQIDAARDALEAALDRYAQWDSGCPEGLSEGIRYSLLAPGKRLRPTLVLLANQCCGGQLEQALPAACAVEMIHAYSLIHDDLPAMDDDELRRGRPTNHVIFGEANAILAGDSLIPRAFEIMARDLKPADVAAKCCETLAHAAGATQLVGGQFDDLSNEARAGTLEALEAIHRRKTGALLRASLRLGGLTAQASESELASLEQFGDQLGLAFQITDDLLDLRGDESKLGKRVGMDDQRGKLTYPALLGIAESERLAEQLIASASREISRFGDRAEGLDIIARYVLERSN